MDIGLRLWGRRQIWSRCRQLFDEELGLTYRKPFRDHLTSSVALGRRIGKRQERAGMTHRQGARHHIRAHFLWELEQPHHVGDRRTVLANGGGNLLLCEAEVVSEAPVR